MKFTETWPRADLDFLADTYPDPKWQPRQIAEKLGVEPSRVYHKAHYLGLARPTRRRLDWGRIAELRAEGVSLDGIAALMGCSRGAVQGALRAMAEQEVEHG